MALYALGLLSQSNRFKEALTEAGWVTIRTEGTHHIVLPFSMTTFCDVPEWDVCLHATETSSDSVIHTIKQKEDEDNAHGLEKKVKE